MTHKHENTSLQNHIALLKSSPIFQLSLGSKELFHSNFWAWLFETPKENSVSGADYVRIFFPDFDSIDYEVRREYLHMDLVLMPKAAASKKLYVIENKIKSDPSYIQLVKYSEKLEASPKKNPFEISGRLLTSILKPKFEMPEGWASKSLLEITEGFECLVGKEEKTYRRELIEDYIRFVRSMTAIIETGPRKDANQPYDFHLGGEKPGNLMELKDLRIYDLYLKRGGSVLQEYLLGELKNEFPELRHSFGYNNNKYMCEMYFSNEDDFRIGIQIEGYQYRYYTMTVGDERQYKQWDQSKKDLNLLPESAKKLIENGWFLDNPKDAYGCNMHKQFCFYKPRFLYQYKLLNGKSFSQIAEMLRADLSKARELLSSNQG